MSLTLNDFLISKVPEVTSLATRAKELNDMLGRGELTRGEFEELVGDLTDLKNINENMYDLEAWREIQKTVDFLKNLKFWATFF